MPMGLSVCIYVEKKSVRVSKRSAGGFYFLPIYLCVFSIIIIIVKKLYARRKSEQFTSDILFNPHMKTTRSVKFFPHLTVNIYYF